MRVLEQLAAAINRLPPVTSIKNGVITVGEEIGPERCRTCDAHPYEARPERAGEVHPPTVPGPCPTCGAAPWCERHRKPASRPPPGAFAVSRLALYRGVSFGEPLSRGGLSRCRTLAGVLAAALVTA